MAHSLTERLLMFWMDWCDFTITFPISFSYATLSEKESVSISSSVSTVFRSAMAFIIRITEALKVAEAFSGNFFFCFLIRDFSRYSFSILQSFSKIIFTGYLGFPGANSHNFFYKLFTHDFIRNRSSILQKPSIIFSAMVLLKGALRGKHLTVKLLKLNLITFQKLTLKILLLKKAPVTSVTSRKSGIFGAFFVHKKFIYFIWGFLFWKIKLKIE